MLADDPLPPARSGVAVYQMRLLYQQLVGACHVIGYDVREGDTAFFVLWCSRQRRKLIADGRRKPFSSSLL